MAGWPAGVNPLVASPALDFTILNGLLFRLRGPGSTEIEKLREPLIEFKFPSVLCKPLGICLGTSGSHLAVGAAWECAKCGVELGAEIENDDDSGCDRESDTDGDDDTGDRFTDSGLALGLPTTSYAHFRLLIYNSEKLEQPAVAFCGYSRVNSDENPFHYTPPVFHPANPLVAWAPGPGETILANYETGEHEIQREAKMSRSSLVIATGKYNSSIIWAASVKLTIYTKNCVSLHAATSSTRSRSPSKQVKTRPSTEAKYSLRLVTLKILPALNAKCSTSSGNLVTMAPQHSG